MGNLAPFSNPRHWPCWTAKDILHRNVAIAAWDAAQAQRTLDEALNVLHEHNRLPLDKGE